MGANLLNDLALFKALSDSNCSFRLVLGSKIGPVIGKNIVYSISEQFNLFGFADHTYQLFNTIQYLEQQGNKLYPPSKEALYWENKGFMHKEFERLRISTPKTKIFSNTSEIDGSIDFPALLKEIHSAGSLGVIKVENFEDLKKEVEKRVLKSQKEFILQELLHIRRDLRVTLVDGKIVHHYWRINTAKDWKPTSTGHGSKVDFKSFPEHWRQEIEDTFAKLNLVTGAFDIAWQNDNLDTKPLFLEISPSYMPNPPIPEKLAASTTYLEYKNSLFPIPKYTIDYADLVIKLKKLVLNSYIEMIKKN